MAKIVSISDKELPALIEALKNPREAELTTEQWQLIEKVLTKLKNPAKKREPKVLDTAPQAEVTSNAPV